MFVEAKSFSTFWHLDFHHWTDEMRFKISITDPGQHTAAEYLGLLETGITTALYFDDSDAALIVEDGVFRFQFNGFEHCVEVNDVESSLRLAIREAQLLKLFA
ncbi:MAG: hypothetical protein K0U52_06305 [Gammaproteobacteria bacterium]|nr:hypothetical protein [Gammaproteobacteria bacterium]